MMKSLTSVAALAAGLAFAALPGNAEAGRRALGPIDEFRAAVRRAGGARAPSAQRAERVDEIFCRQGVEDLEDNSY